MFSSFFALLARHSCQDRNTDTSSNAAAIALPAPSGISYESLHYPLAAEQQYQAIPPLMINTGRIPLIRHAVHAPMQYFTSNTGNRQTSAAAAETATTRRSALRRRPTATATATAAIATTAVGTAAATTIATGPQNGPRTRSPTTTTYSAETRATDRRPPLQHGNGYEIADDDVGGRRASVRAQSTGRDDGRLEADGRATATAAAKKPNAKTADAESERKTHYGNAVGTAGTLQRRENVNRNRREMQPNVNNNGGGRPVLPTMN